MRPLGIPPAPHRVHPRPVRSVARSAASQAVTTTFNSITEVEGAGGSHVRAGPVFRRKPWREPVKLLKTLSLAAGIAAATSAPASALDISGAGATFPYPIYAKWADAYKKETGTSLNYQS